MTLPSLDQFGTAATIAAATSANVPAPASLAKDTVGVIRLAFSDVATAITWPAGWAELYQGAVGLEFYFGAAWKRLAVADGGSSPQCTWAIAGNGRARMVTFANALDVGNPFEAVTVNTGTSTSIDGSGITTLGPDRLLLEFGFFDRSNAIPAVPSWAEQEDAGSGGVRLFLETRAALVAGFVAAGSATPVANDDWGTIVCALKPKRPRSTMIA